MHGSRQFSKGGGGSPASDQGGPASDLGGPASELGESDNFLPFQNPYPCKSRPQVSPPLGPRMLKKEHWNWQVMILI